MSENTNACPDCKYWQNLVREEREDWKRLVDKKDKQVKHFQDALVINDNRYKTALDKALEALSEIRSDAEQCDVIAEARAANCFDYADQALKEIKGVME